MAMPLLSRWRFLQVAARNGHAGNSAAFMSRTRDRLEAIRGPESDVEQ
jgi:hypothetical protein